MAGGDVSDIERGAAVNSLCKIIDAGSAVCTFGSLGENFGEHHHRCCSSQAQCVGSELRDTYTTVSYIGPKILFFCGVRAAVGTKLIGEMLPYRTHTSMSRKGGWVFVARSYCLAVRAWLGVRRWFNYFQCEMLIVFTGVRFFFSSFW